jgi:hypothetical protein
MALGRWPSPRCSSCGALQRSFQSRSHTAPDAVQRPGTVTVTMAVHPFRGLQLTIIRLERDYRGRRHVLVEHPQVGQLRLPVEWTDRTAPIVPPRARGCELRVNAEGLLNVAAACRVALGEKLDTSDAPTTLVAAPEQKSRGANAPSSDVVVGAVDGDAAKPPRGLGDARAQGDSRRGRRGGGK